MTHEWDIDPKEVSIGDIIGHGNFADVCLGTYKKKPHAIKRMKVQYLHSIAKERFEREVSTLYNLHDKNIVTVKGACISPGKNCIVMELLKYNLKELVYCEHPEKNGWKKLTWRDKLRILRHIGHALNNLHGKKILHRDIKADNVMLDETMKVPKLIDFGLAQTYASSLSTGVQSSKLVEGTMNWMSPEALAGKVSVASDIWSFGCLCYEVFTGLPPFMKEFHNEDALRSFIKDPSSDFSCLKVEGEKFAPLNKIIQACIQYKPENRKGLREVVGMIDSLLNETNSWLDDPSLPQPLEDIDGEFGKTSMWRSIQTLRSGFDTRTSMIQDFISKISPSEAKELASKMEKLEISNEGLKKAVEMLQDRDLPRSRRISPVARLILPPPPVSSYSLPSFPSPDYYDAPIAALPSRSISPVSFSLPTRCTPSYSTEHHYPGTSTGMHMSTRGSANGREVMQGPRGGLFYTNSHGNRTYISKKDASFG